MRTRLALGALAAVTSIVIPVSIATANATDKVPGMASHPATIGPTAGVGLRVRTSPTGEFITNLPTGTNVIVGCQTEGPAVTNEFGLTSTVWDYLPDRKGYVADAYVRTGHFYRIPGVPDCKDAFAQPKPTVKPTAKPTGKPTTTAKPTATAKPTTKPTSQPTTKPTSKSKLVGFSQFQGHAQADYDCGPSSVLAVLLYNGIDVAGWDPSYPVPALNTVRNWMPSMSEAGATRGDIVASLEALSNGTARAATPSETFAHVKNGGTAVLLGNTSAFGGGGWGHYIAVLDYNASDDTYLIHDSNSYPSAIAHLTRRPANEVRAFAAAHQDTGGGAGVTFSR